MISEQPCTVATSGLVLKRGAAATPPHPITSNNLRRKRQDPQRLYIPNPLGELPLEVQDSQLKHQAHRSHLSEFVRNGTILPRKTTPLLSLILRACESFARQYRFHVNIRPRGGSLYAPTVCRLKHSRRIQQPVIGVHYVGTPFFSVMHGIHSHDQPQSPINQSDEHLHGTNTGNERADITT